MHTLPNLDAVSLPSTQGPPCSAPSELHSGSWDKALLWKHPSLTADAQQQQKNASSGFVFQSVGSLLWSIHAWTSAMSEGLLEASVPPTVPVVSKYLLFVTQMFGRHTVW